MNRRKIKVVGFTLIEVLIALVVLSIGLLGISALVMNTLKASDSSRLRSQAIVLANAILDSMRGNIPAAVSGQYDIALGTSAPAAVNCLNNALASQCSAQQIAQSDLHNWKQQLGGSATLAAALPAGDGSVTTATAAGYTTVTIVVSWDDTRAVSAFSGCPPAPAACPLSGTTQTITIESVL